MIRFVPRSDMPIPPVLEKVEIVGQRGSIELSYRFPRVGPVELRGALDFLTDGWTPLISWAGPRMELSSSRPITPAAAAHLERALLPLVAGFRAISARVALRYWRQVSDEEWETIGRVPQMSRPPQLRVDIAWNPGGAHEIKTYLNSPGDKDMMVQWVPQSRNEVIGRLSTTAIARDVTSLWRQASDDHVIASEMVAMHKLGGIAVARLSGKA